jgi:hypothetical protein
MSGVRRPLGVFFQKDRESLRRCPFLEGASRVERAEGAPVPSLAVSQSDAGK